MTAIGAISVKQSNLNKTHDPVLDRCPKLLFLSFIDYWHLDENLALNVEAAVSSLGIFYILYIWPFGWPYGLIIRDIRYYTSLKEISSF